MKQLTYIMVKPEFAEMPNVIALVKEEAAKAGMKILREKFVMYTKELAQKHYAEHFRGSYENAKGFYMGLENYITSGRAYGMVMEGENAIETMRAHKVQFASIRNGIQTAIDNNNIVDINSKLFELASFMNVDLGYKSQEEFIEKFDDMEIAL